MKQNEMNRVNETKVVCPICGAEFAIADKTHVATGVVIGKDAGLGTIHPEVVGKSDKLPSKAADRIEALRAAGVDVSSFFAMTGANGGESVATLRNGQLSILDDNDPIYDYILSGGDVYNAKLARRWVMAQMFRMLSREEYGYWGRTYSITDQIRAKGYDYQWKQLEDELYAQGKMLLHDDMENYEDRNRWFNKELVICMMQDYIKQLKMHVKHLRVRKCKGVPYKNICGENVFITDIDKKVFAPVEMMINEIRKSSSLMGVYYVVKRFNRIRKQRTWNPKQCAEWVDAYKGAGAFFTMQNMVRYHGCRFCGLNKEASYKELKALANEYRGEGWRMIGVLRKFLEENNVDINAKMAEWRNN